MIEFWQQFCFGQNARQTGTGSRVTLLKYSNQCSLRMYVFVFLLDFMEFIVYE